MKSNIYNTFDEINKELAIRKVEKDIAYQKLLKNLDKTKESLEIRNLMGDTPRKAMNILGMLSGPVKSAALTFLFKKIF